MLWSLVTITPVRFLHETYHDYSVVSHMCIC